MNKNRNNRRSLQSMMFVMGFLVAGLLLVGATVTHGAPMSTYPLKETPVEADQVLIVDSQDANRTKRAALGDLPGTGGTDLTAGTNIDITTGVISVTGLGAAASLGATNGTIDHVVVWVDDGTGTAALPIAVPEDISELTDTTNIIPADVSELTDTTGVIPADVGDLTDTGGLLGGTGLPSGCTNDHILVADSVEVTGWKCIALNAHPLWVSLVETIGANEFTITPETPASYPHYFGSGTFDLDFNISGSNVNYDIDTVTWKEGTDPYVGDGVTHQGGDLYRFSKASLAEGTYSYRIRACDDKGTPNCSPEEGTAYSVTVDTTAPLVDLNP